MTNEETYAAIMARTMTEDEIQAAMQKPGFAAYFERKQMGEFAEPAPEGITPSDEEMAAFRSRLRRGDA